MQLVVVMAVRKAVSAATATFANTSIIFPFFIMFNVQWSMFNDHHSLSSPPVLFVKVLLVTSLLTPSLMAMAFTVVVALREKASL